MSLWSSNSTNSSELKCFVQSGKVQAVQNGEYKQAQRHLYKPIYSGDLMQDYACLSIFFKKTFSLQIVLHHSGIWRP